jgi:hypothetical protein
LETIYDYSAAEKSTRLVALVIGLIFFIQLSLGFLLSENNSLQAWKDSNISELFIEKDLWLSEINFFYSEQKLFRISSQGILSLKQLFEDHGFEFGPETYAYRTCAIATQLIFAALIFVKISFIFLLFGLLLARLFIRPYFGFNFLGLSSSSRIFDQDLHLTRSPERKEHLPQIPASFAPELIPYSKITGTTSFAILKRFKVHNGTTTDLLGIVYFYAPRTEITLVEQLLIATLSQEQQNNLSSTDAELTSEIRKYSKNLMNNRSHTLLACFVLANLAAAYFLRKNFSFNTRQVYLWARDILNSLPTLSLDYSASELNKIRKALAYCQTTNIYAKELSDRETYDLITIGNLLEYRLLSNNLNLASLRINAALDQLNCCLLKEVCLQLSPATSDKSSNILYDNNNLYIKRSWLASFIDSKSKADPYLNEYFARTTRELRPQVLIQARTLSYESKISFEVIQEWLAHSIFLHNYKWSKHSAEIVSKSVFLTEATTITDFFLSVSLKRIRQIADLKSLCLQLRAQEISHPNLLDNQPTHTPLNSVGEL